MAIKNVIFGIHAVLSAVKKAPETIVSLFIQQGRLDARLQEIVDAAAIQGIKPQQANKQKLDLLAENGVHQGVVAECRANKQYTEDDLPAILAEANGAPFILILDGIQDPHNLGACLRTADAAGVHCVISPQDRAVGLTPSVRKVASGAAEHVPFIPVVNLVRTMEYLKENGVWIYGAAGEATKTVFDTELTGALALVLGAEEKGLRRLTRETCDALISIPMFGSVGSLNVSVATAICLYEAVRQRIPK